MPTCEHHSLFRAYKKTPKDVIRFAHPLLLLLLMVLEDLEEGTEDEGANRGVHALQYNMYHIVDVTVLLVLG